MNAEDIQNQHVNLIFFTLNKLNFNYNIFYKIHSFIAFAPLIIYILSDYLPCFSFSSDSSIFSFKEIKEDK